MTHKRSALYMLAHDEWCSHDETDDGIECDCHLSVIASLRKQVEAAEKKARDWEEICRHLKAEKPDQHRPAHDK